MKMENLNNNIKKIKIIIKSRNRFINNFKLQHWKSSIHSYFFEFHNHLVSQRVYLLNLLISMNMILILNNFNVFY